MKELESHKEQCSRVSQCSEGGLDNAREGGVVCGRVRKRKETEGRAHVGSDHAVEEHLEVLGVALGRSLDRSTSHGCKV
jgi:hypothetical protein